MSEPSDAAKSARIPLDKYKVSVLEAKKGKTEKGDPKIVLDLEFKGNPPINVEGNEVDINGVKLTKHSVCTEKALKYFNKERRALGLPVINSVAEFDNLDVLDYKRMEGWAICSAKSVEKKNDVTGEVIMNPYTNEPMVDHYRQLDEWIAPV